MITLLAERYRIMKSLGEGGMADVYLAKDEILHRDVAIKILRGDLSSDPITLLRFQREASAVSMLHHPNVVEIYDVGEWEHRHYIVMEYIPGKTLKQLIALRGALDKEEAVSIMKQLTSAIVHAHEHNLIHRDIKPQNVLVKDDGTVKITDFGIALAHGAIQLTQSDSVLGSAHYIAPETTRGEQPTNQIDIYALGIVFYEMLRGEPPFKGDNPVQIAMMHLKDEIPSILEFNPTLPQSIDNVIRKATVKNRNLRYHSANELLEDVSQCLQKQDVPPLQFALDEDDQETLVMERTPQKEEVQETKKKKGISAQSIIGWLLITISIVALGAMVYFSGVLTNLNMNKEIEIPDVSNLNMIEATEKLTQLGFSVSGTTKEELSSTIAKGDVISTNPTIGSMQLPGTLIQLIVSKGEPFEIQNYVGMNISEVETLLKNTKITIAKEFRPDKNSAYGTILEQSGLTAGMQVDPNKPATIKLYIASNPEFVIPDVIGYPIEQAKAQLEMLGGVVSLQQLDTSGMSDEELETLERGVVVDITPMIGSLYIQNYGLSITIYYY